MPIQDPINVSVFARTVYARWVYGAVARPRVVAIIDGIPIEGLFFENAGYEQLFDEERTAGGKLIRQHGISRRRWRLITRPITFIHRNRLIKHLEEADWGPVEFFMDNFGEINLRPLPAYVDVLDERIVDSQNRRSLDLLIVEAE